MADSNRWGMRAQVNTDRSTMARSSLLATSHSFPRATVRRHWIRGAVCCLLVAVFVWWRGATCWHYEVTGRNSGYQQKADSNADLAYVFYATSDPYACAVLVNIERLRQLNSTISIHVLATPGVGKQYLAAFRSAGGRVHIEKAPELDTREDDTWRDCLLKIVSFKMHLIEPRLRRILVLDADQLILKSLDHLFSFPETDLVAPRAYWRSPHWLSSTLMLISLSDRLWQDVDFAMKTLRPGWYDMELVNQVLGGTAYVLGGEYATLNSHWADWDLPDWYRPKLHATGPDRNVSPGGARSPRSYAEERSLYELQELSNVIHFSAIGKPWETQTSKEALELSSAYAHPLLKAQYSSWRSIARQVCPGHLSGLAEE